MILKLTIPLETSYIITNLVFAFEVVHFIYFKMFIIIVRVFIGIY
jgi:hypothetical protein